MIQQHMWNWGLFISKNMLSHIGVDNFLGGDFGVLVASGRKRHMQKRKWRARKRKRTLRRKWNPAGPNRSWRQRRQSRTPPLWQRLRRENWGGWGSWITAGSQASWTPNQSLYEVSTSSSDVFCFIPLSQSGLLPLCLPDWKQISVQTQSTYLITQSSSHYWTSLWHPNNGTPPSFSSAVVQRARVSTSFLAKTLDWIFGLDSFQSSIVLSYSFFSFLENKYLYQTRVLLLLGFFFTKA